MTAGATPEFDQDAGAYLEALIRPDARPYAERAPLALASVARLLDCAGNPHHGLRVVHIGGSKGKGSTALLLEALLQAAGHRTGTFTSPHLERWTERFRVGGAEISGERLAAVLGALHPHVQRLARAHPDNPPSFFDVATAAALRLFREAAVDYAVVEVGLGGRHDATNVVQPVVSCLTGVELEHTDKLGPDLASIAREKAGIIKRGIPAVLAPLPAPAERVVLEEARRLEAPVVRIGRELQVAHTTRGGESALAVRGPGWAVQTRLPLPAPHQAQNAALALACAWLAGAVAPPRLAETAVRAWRELVLPGRAELLARSPWVVADGAHTEASARALSQWLGTLPPRRWHLVLSVSAGKCLRDLCGPLLHGPTRTVTATAAEPSRSLGAEALAAGLKEIRPGVQVRVEPDPAAALAAALADLAPDEGLCATGSVYMAGLARSVLRRRLGLRTI